MILPKTIRSLHYMKLLQLQNPLLTSFSSPKSSEILFIYSISGRPFSLSAQFAQNSVKETQKPTDISRGSFTRAISGSERTNGGGVEAKNTEIAKSQEIFGNLEEDARNPSKEMGDNWKSPSLISRKSYWPKVNLFALFPNIDKGKAQESFLFKTLGVFFKSAISGSEKTNSDGVEAKNTEIAKSQEMCGNLEEDVKSLRKERSEYVKSPSLISVKSELNEQNGSKVNLYAFCKDKGRAEFAQKHVNKSQKPTHPLSVFFKRAISGSGRTHSGGVEAKNTEIVESREIIGHLEENVRNLSKQRVENGKLPSVTSVKNDSNEQNLPPKVSLSALFTKKKGNVKVMKPTDSGYEDSMVHKELSSDMQMLAYHLYMEGYFKDANFMPKNEFDATLFERKQGREFLKFAAAKFGEDHQEIAKWLSASDLKSVALFGCPSRAPKTAYAAKHMRRFFQIDEQKVCQKCALRKSCMVVNKSGKNYTQLDLANVIKVLVVYAMEPVPEQSVVPEEINASVGRLLKEIINLSQTTSSAFVKCIG